MKKVYLDKTDAKLCMSVFVRDAEVIAAGTTVYAMSAKHENSEYQRYADEYDIHFIFDDNVPNINFYTIPQVDIFATDSDGGLLGSVGQMIDLESQAPICYIDKNQNCFLLEKNGKEFLAQPEQWKSQLTPYADIEFFASREAAEKKYEFLNREEIEREICE